MHSQQELETRLAKLEDALTDLQRRLSLLEERRRTDVRAGGDLRLAGEAGPPESIAAHESTGSPAPATGPTRDAIGLTTLLGRTFMVFGGAYLLRALTESGRVPVAAGVIIGLAYSLTWLVAAHRVAATRPTSAQFHGVTALLVGLPIVWEATTRFGLMTPVTAALALAIMSALAMAIAWRGDLDAVAATAAFGTIATAFVTAWSSDHFGVFSLLLIGLSTVTYWLSERPGRAWLRWPNAVAAGLSVMGVTIRGLETPPLEPAWLVLAAQGALLATMQGSLAVRIVMFGRNARFFDIMQAASGLLIGMGGATLLARDSAAGLGLIGAIASLLASGAYLAAFLRLADRPHMARSYHLFAAFGLASAVAALLLLFRGTPLTLAALAMGLVMIGLGPHRLAGYAALHGSAYVLTALATSNLLWSAAAVWILTPDPWPAMSVLEWLTLASAGAFATMRPVPHYDVGDLLARIGRVLLASLFVFATGGAIVMTLGPLVAGTPPDAGVLATLRTAVLSIAVVVLGMTGRWRKTATFRRLVYPLLVVGGLRLVADDFVHSSPATLFIALALYGLAWVMGPRLAARK